MPTNPWPEDLTGELLNLNQDGWTAREIAARLRTTRNAIIGKLWRLGVSAASPTMRPRRNGGRLTRPQPRPPRIRKLIESPPLLCMPDPRATGEDALRALRIGDCRWPIGDPHSPEFRFCGAACEAGQTYCDAHYVISVRVP